MHSLDGERLLYGVVCPGSTLTLCAWRNTWKGAKICKLVFTAFKYVMCAYGTVLKITLYMKAVGKRRKDNT